MRKMGIALGLGISVSGVLGSSCAAVRPVAPAASQPPPPAEPSSAQSASLLVGGLNRSYLVHLPAKLPTAAPILLLLHGSGGSGKQMRASTAYRFDQLADEQGLIVAYPDGFERHWNDCRKVAHYSARTRNIDDLGFLRALIEHLHKTYGADSRRVYAVGYSNGGHMAFRLALEAPELLTGIAAVAASLPAPENMDCQASGRPVPVLLLNGTEDPINPYQGGDVTIFGHGNRGRVLSTADSAAWFAQLDGATPAVTAERLPSTEPADKGWAERSVWKSPAGMEVGLFTIHGGGHTLPQAQIRYPAQLGNTFTGLDGPQEIWRFFARQPLRSP